MAGVSANVILERIGARSWVFCVMTVWGLPSASNAPSTNLNQFLRGAISLGHSGSGVCPRHVSLSDLWFPRRHLARLTAYFMIAVPLSFVIGRSVSSLILGMDGLAGLRGWQWLFLMEGLAAFLLALAVLKYLPDGPVRASWLMKGEKQTIAARLQTEEPWSARSVARPARFARRCVWNGVFGCECRCLQYLVVAAADREGDGLFRSRHRLGRRVVFCGGHSRDDAQQDIRMGDVRLSVYSCELNQRRTPYRIV